MECVGNHRRFGRSHEYDLSSRVYDRGDTRPFNSIHTTFGRHRNSELLLSNEFHNASRSSSFKYLSLYSIAHVHFQASFLLNDFDNSMNMSKQLDSQITSDAANVSPLYTDLLSLVARQAMGAIEITLSKGPDGSFNSSDIMAFMMDMGGVGGKRYGTYFHALNAS